MNQHIERVGVIGAGPMGLACAYELLKTGRHVTIYERDSRIGGMSASFNFDGLKVERYYHFICTPDRTLFQYLSEFGLSDRLRWRETKMGFFYEGTLYKWGNPLYLLKFPKLDLLSKIRFGLHAYAATKIRDWRPLDKISATDWLLNWVGPKAYDVLWKKLFDLKFFEYRDSLSAAWLGTRIQRVGLSRKNPFVERLGYLEGGSDTLLDECQTRIIALGGVIQLNADIQRIRIENGRVRGLDVGGSVESCDCVVSTIPLPYLVRLAPGLPQDETQKIAAIKNIGIVCVTLKLKQSLTDNFWININDCRIEVPGIIEYSNLNPLANTIVYAPFYMPKTHPKYSRPKEQFIAEVLGYLALINPEFRTDWVLGANAFRYEFAQTICTPGFYEKLPPIRSDVSGLYMADTSHYYPEDRSISESMRIGKYIAQILSEESNVRSDGYAVLPDRG